jgi:hypothetical protein
MESHQIGGAHAEHGDWEGTVALDDQPGAELGDLLGIDPDLYWVLGFKVWCEEDCFVDAYVVEKTARFEELQDRASERRGRIPVIRMRRPVENLASVIGLFKRFTFSVIARHHVTDRGNHLAVESALVWDDERNEWTEDKA